MGTQRTNSNQKQVWDKRTQWQHYFFLLLGKGLVGLVRKTIKKQLYKRVRVWKKEFLVKLLYFAYDTLFVCEADKENIIVRKIVLRCFEMVSRLRMNFYNVYKEGSSDKLC